jgi:hypothetical protein
VLRDHGHTTIASDILDYKFPLHFVADFLTVAKAPAGVECTTTNPPFQIVNDFVAHALDLCPRVIMLARLAFLESERRTEILEHRGLARVHIFRNRLPMMHRDSWDGTRASNAITAASRRLTGFLGSAIDEKTLPARSIPPAGSPAAAT